MALELYVCAVIGDFIHRVTSFSVVWGGVSVDVLGASPVFYVVVACRGSVFVSISMCKGDRWTTDGRIRFGGVRLLSARKKVRISSIHQLVWYQVCMDEGLRFERH